MSPETKIEMLRGGILFICVLSLAVGFCAFKAGFHAGAADAYLKVAKTLKDCGMPFFSIAPDGQSITCHVCGLTSHHPEDVKQKYCGRCHVFHVDRARQLVFNQPPLSN